MENDCGVVMNLIGHWYEPCNGRDSTRANDVPSYTTGRMERWKDGGKTAYQPTQLFYSSHRLRVERYYSESSEAVTSINGLRWNLQRGEQSHSKTPTASEDESDEKPCNYVGKRVRS